MAKKTDKGIDETIARAKKNIAASKELIGKVESAQSEYAAWKEENGVTDEKLKKFTESLSGEDKKRYDEAREELERQMDNMAYKVDMKKAEALREYSEGKKLTSEKIGEIVALIPDGWLDRTEPGETPEELRGVYRTYLTERLNHSEIFVNQARDAREALI